MGERLPEHLMEWQWRLYPRNHASRLNLIIHILTVPLFCAGTVAAVLTPLVGWRGLLGLPVMLLAFAAQGFGHGREAIKAEPFLGPGNFVGRVFLEQWTAFPRYVISGGAWRAWKAGGQRGSETGSA